MTESFCGPAVIVDLRQESHGWINGAPVTWLAQGDAANLGKTPAEAAERERSLLQDLTVRATVEVALIDADDSPSHPQELAVESVQSEEELVRSLGLGYHRLYVTDHLRPSDQEVDGFLQFVAALAPGTWLHFHCRGGKGRTTTLLAMYDMLRNADRVSCEEVMARQAAAHPCYDLRDLHSSSSGHLSYRERLDFLQVFHVFARERKKGCAGAWSDWLGATYYNN